MKPIKSKVGLRVLAGGLLWLLALGALAAQTKIGDLYYNLNATDQTATVTRKYYDGAYIKYSGDIVIPESVTYSSRTYAVTSIGASAFSDCADLTAITLPASLTSIGASAFSGCTGLTAIEVESSNAHYCSVDGVLYNKAKTRLKICPGGKTAVSIPSSVTGIDSIAFEKCTGLASIEIPSTVDTVGAEAFRACTGLTSVTIAARETPLYFERDVFYSSPVRTLYLGGRMRYSGDCYPFRNLLTLEAVTVGASVRSIDRGTFAGCTGLTSIELPATLDSVGALAFNGCAGLTSVRIADRGTALKFYNATASDITGIFGQSPVRTLYLGGDINYYTTYDEYGDGKEEEKSSFSGMQTLDTLCIGPSVTAIGGEAFSGCTGLKHVTIADRETVLRLGGDVLYDIRDVFKSCPIQSLYMGGDVDYYFYYSPFEDLTTLDTVTFGRLVTGLRDGLFKGCTGLRAVQLPRRVTAIGASAFEGCTGLTSIAIPNSVTEIGGSAFEGCTGLTEVAMPAATSIGGAAFRGCTGLTEVAMPAVTEIGGSAFSGCTGLTEVAMPKVTKIGNEAFSGCTGLTSVAMPAVTEIGDYYNDKTGVFSGCTGLTEVAMPAATSIGGSAFSGCTGLTEVAMPKVTKIGDSAFSGCTGLTEVAMPVARKIGESAFSGCTGLTEVKMPNLGYNNSNGVVLGTGAFAGCTGLRSVAMGLSDESNYERGKIGAGVFEGCTNLVSVQWETRAGGLRSVPARCFAGCTALEDIGADWSWSGLWTIGDSAFMGCKALKLKELGLRQVKSIGKRAFQNCHGLHLLSVSDSLLEIGIGVFEGCAALDTLILGQSLDFIAYDAFKGCTGLRSVTCRGAAPAECEDGAFTGVDKAACRLLVPQASVDAYGAAAEWRDFDLEGGDVHVAVASLTLPREFFIELDAVGSKSFRVLEASVAPVYASNPVLAWSTSSDGTVAIKRTNGYDVELGQGNYFYSGTAVITARTTDGSNLSAECRVTVGRRATAIRITAYGSDETLSETELTYGRSLRLEADIEPSYATNRVVAWTSSAPDVLRVDSLGWVRTVGFGTATVTARTTDGSDLEATCEVTVTGVPVKTLRIEAAGGASAVVVGHSLRLSAVITPSNASIKRVIWSSSDEGVAKVDSTGTVSGLAIGEAIITARTTDGSDLSATCDIKVVEGTAVEVPDALQAVRVYAEAGRIEVRGLPLGTAVTLSGVDGRLWYQTEAVTGSELSLVAPCGHVYVLRLNHMHSFKVYLP